MAHLQFDLVIAHFLTNQIELLISMNLTEPN